VVFLYIEEVMIVPSDPSRGSKRLPELRTDSVGKERENDRQNYIQETNARASKHVKDRQEPKEVRAAREKTHR
jgi:hypothetical protein